MRETPGASDGLFLKGKSLGARNVTMTKIDDDKGSAYC